MLDFLRDHQEILAWLGIFSVLSFVGSLVLIPILCVRINADYFMPCHDVDHTLAGHKPLVRWAWLILRQVLGLVLITGGIAMLVLPGQGILTILIGLMCLSFPGKRALELRLIRLPALLTAINALRKRAGHEPLKLPPD